MMLFGYPFSRHSSTSILYFVYQKCFTWPSAFIDFVTTLAIFFRGSSWEYPMVFYPGLLVAIAPVLLPVDVVLHLS